MQYRPFGLTDQPVSVIGMGTWYIDLADRDTAIRALRTGLDHGMNHIDTAEMYGHAELVIKDAIREAIAPQGHVAVIDDPKQLDIVPFKRKSVSVHWEFMFTRPVFETKDMIEQHNLLNKAAALFDEGVLRHTMKEDFGPINAANLRRALPHQDSGMAIGKSVLTGF